MISAEDLDIKVFYLERISETMVVHEITKGNRIKRRGKANSSTLGNVWDKEDS